MRRRPAPEPVPAVQMSEVYRYALDPEGYGEPSPELLAAVAARLDRQERQREAPYVLPRPPA